jgi:hypothetical protein
VLVGVTICLAAPGEEYPALAYLCAKLFTRLLQELTSGNVSLRLGKYSPALKKEFCNFLHQ